VAVLLQRAHSNLDDRLWRSVVRPPSRLPRQRCSCTQSSTDVACSRLGGRKSDGRDGKRTGNTGHHRSLTVNNGHSKTGPEQGRNAVTRAGEDSCKVVRFPQLHDALNGHLPGLLAGVKDRQGDPFGETESLTRDLVKETDGGIHPRASSRRTDRSCSARVTTRSSEARAGKGRTATRPKTRGLRFLRNRASGEDNTVYRRRGRTKGRCGV
jgi:hypothetical protein